MDELVRLKQQFAKLQAKANKQRNEIARLTQAVEQLQKDKASLLADLKWKGEKHEISRQAVFGRDRIS